MLSKFYNDILPSAGFYCVALMPERHHIWVDAIEDLVEQTLAQGDRLGVYFGTAAYLSDANRKAVNVQSLKALRVDIDAGAAKHARDPDGTYASQREALTAAVSFVKAEGFMPTYIISSGEGLHLYWCLDREVTTSEWMPLAEGLRNLCAKHSLRIDPTVTCDTARILRPLGTMNKNGRRVEVLRDTKVFHSVETLTEKLGAEFVLPATRKYDLSVNDEVASTYVGPPSSALKIAEHCGALREVAAARGDVQEPLWRAMIGLVKRTVEGIDIAHEWSDGYDGYNPSEVQRKFDGWTTGPTTCAEFGRHTKACEDCKFAGKVKSPINLGLMTTEAIEALPEEKRAEIAVAQEPAPPTPAPGKPWDGHIPAGFDVVAGKDGGWVLNHTYLTQKQDESGESVPVMVTVPFTRDIFWFGQWAEADSNADNAMVTLHLWTGKGVRNYLLDQALVASMAKFLEFLAGKAIHTTTHKKAAQSMIDYAKGSLQRIKSLTKRPKIADHLGLRILENGDLVAAHGHHVILPDGSIQRGMLSSNLIGVADQFPVPVPPNPAGEWPASVWPEHIEPRAREHVEFLKRYYEAPGMERFQLAIMLGLASPLMSFVTGEFHQGSALPKMSALSVSLFSRETARGKTTACMSAVLAYGKPSELTNDTGKAGTTDLGRNARLSIHGTLPNVMDEMGGATPASVASIISSVANGSGRVQSTREGGLKSGTSYALINLITTNTSQRDMIAAVQSNSGAIQYRLLEINVEDMPEYDLALRTAFAEDWAKLNRHCTGALGAVIHREICAMGAERANKLVADCCERAARLVEADQSARFQTRALGAMLACQLILARVKMAPFALPPIVAAFRVAHDAGKSFVADNVLPTDGLELLSRALLELAPNTIVTESETHLGRNSTKFDMPLNSRIPDLVLARHVRAVGRTYLSVNALRDWCTKKGVSENEIVREGRKHEVIRTHERPRADGGRTHISAETYNLTKGMRETMDLRCRCYTVDVRRLAGCLGQTLTDPVGDNVVPLVPREAPDAPEATGTEAT
jgi:hypothetical protein